jgi:polysaccharide chain length determinant protein (PEP-CTERM system associated)
MENYRSEILRYLKLIYAKRYLFIAVSLCIMSVIVWGSYFMPKKYKAESRIIIESNVIEKLVEGIAITPSMDDRIRVLKNTMVGTNLVESVIRKLGLDLHVDNGMELEKMIMDFQDKTGIKIENRTLITVSLVDKNPALARDYINLLVNEYVENNIFAKREEASDATDFLGKQVEFYKERMDRGEDAIIKFRQQQGIYISLDEEALIREIKGYETEIEKLKIDENELLAKKKSIGELLAKEKPFTVTMFSKKGMEGTLESAQNKLSQLLLQYTDNYPEVIRVRAEIEVIEKQQREGLSDSAYLETGSEITAVNPVYQDLKQQIIDITSRVDAINSRAKHLTALIKEKEEELKNIPESKKKLRDLEKDRDSYRSIYNGLLHRLGQSEVSRQMEIEDKTTTFRIIEKAMLPTVPVSPNRILLILAGIGIGFGAGIGFIILLDNLDDSVKTIDMLKEFGLPILAVIPHMAFDEGLTLTRKKDKLVFGIAGVYMLCILGALILELLGITLIEDLISGIMSNKNI